jgi:hypothetical protein
MAGLDPAIHEKPVNVLAIKTWMPGTSPGMTIEKGDRYLLHSDAPSYAAEKCAPQSDLL